MVTPQQCKAKIEDQERRIQTIKSEWDKVKIRANIEVEEMDRALKILRQHAIDLDHAQPHNDCTDLDATIFNLVEKFRPPTKLI
jgi:hypothetical protein